MTVCRSPLVAVCDRCDMDDRYTNHFCGVCHTKTNHKVLPLKRDELKRTLMVCTKCGSHRPARKD